MQKLLAHFLLGTFAFGRLPKFDQFLRCREFWREMTSAHQVKWRAIDLYGRDMFFTSVSEIECLLHRDRFAHFARLVFVRPLVAVQVAALRTSFTCVNASESI